jgi:hypothetical protein
MKVMVKNKEPMQVDLNRQELLVRPKDVGKKKGAIGWEIVEWHDFPVPIEVEESAEPTH